MNKREKIVQGRFLDDEEAVLQELEKTYNRALKDIEKKSQSLYEEINRLQAYIDTEQDADEKARLQSMQQSKIYQKQYQDALKKQVNGILDTMQAEEFQHISDYLKKCYEDGFIGTMYNLHGQGIPLIFPIDQEAVTRAVQIDSKISNSLYSLCGENVAELKKRIAAEVSRGIATGASFHEIARQIRANMIGDYKKAGGALYRSELIARTEGHRVQIQGTMDACYKAKDRGADVVKQWDSTLDSRTRESHQIVDGEIRELDERFSNGLKYPGDSAGGAAEVCNCRCALNQRARKGLDADELEILKERAEFFGLDKSKNFDDFKEKYLKAAEQVKREEKFAPAKTKKEAEDFAKKSGVKYADYSKLPIETANELNRALVTLPENARPVVVSDSATLEKLWGGKFQRSSKKYYGVTIDTFDGIHLGFDESVGKSIMDFDTNGYMVGISSSYKTLDKITAAKQTEQARYKSKYGRSWFFNEEGKTTPFHEMGHVYANINGLPDGFDFVSEKWAEQSKCDMLKKPSEAWAEAWASYHTGINLDKIPDDVLEFIRKASGE